MLRVLIAAVALAATGVADTYSRQPGVDVLHYIFQLTLSDDRDEIVGDATVDVRFVRAGVTTLVLDFAAASDGKGMTVTQVTSNGGNVPWVHRADRLAITLAPVSNAGERRQFTVHYRGVPVGGLRIGANKYGDRTFFSLSWPDKARQWLPMIDHPSDKATSEFIVTAPARYQVVANGSLQEQRDLGDGRRLTHWRESVPIASGLNAIGVAQFSVRHAGAVKDVPLQSWVYPQDRDAGVVMFEEPARKAIEFFSERIGPYPYEKVANIEAPGFTGGTEHASAIFYGEKAMAKRPANGLVAHEIAHQWFGNSVTESDWDDVWLSEGFATYFAALATEHYDGRDAFVASMKRSREQVFKTELAMPGVAVVQEKPWKGIPNAIVYQKGAWV